MATYDEIRDAIEARLLTVPDVGHVEDYRRAVTSYADLEAAYVATVGGVKQIRAWSIAWEAAELRPSGWQADGTMLMAGAGTFVVRGYMSANDAQASDKTFSALLRLALRALATCMAGLSPRQSHVPVTLRTNGYLNFEVPGMGTALVHHAEIAVPVQLQEVV